MWQLFGLKKQTLCDTFIPRQYLTRILNKMKIIDSNRFDYIKTLLVFLYNNRRHYGLDFFFKNKIKCVEKVVSSKLNQAIYSCSTIDLTNIVHHLTLSANVHAKLYIFWEYFN